jgi:hypothetical protein
MAFCIINLPYAKLPNGILLCGYYYFFKITKKWRIESRLYHPLIKVMKRALSFFAIKVYIFAMNIHYFATMMFGKLLELL